MQLLYVFVSEKFKCIFACEHLKCSLFFNNCDRFVSGEEGGAMLEKITSFIFSCICIIFKFALHFVLFKGLHLALSRVKVLKFSGLNLFLFVYHSMFLPFFVRIIKYERRGGKRNHTIFLKLVKRSSLIHLRQLEQNILLRHHQQHKDNSKVKKLK